MAVETTSTAAAAGLAVQGLLCRAPAVSREGSGCRLSTLHRSRWGPRLEGDVSRTLGLDILCPVLGSPVPER